MNMFEIGSKLREARKAKGLTIAECGVSIKMSPAVIGGIETGIVNEVGSRKLMKYAEFLGMSIGVQKKQTPGFTLDDAVEERHQELRDAFNKPSESSRT